MNHNLKIVGVILPAMFLAGCTDMAEKKQLEQKVIALSEAVTVKDMEIQKLRDELSVIQQASSAALAKSMTGKQIQEALKAAGFDPGPIDGKVGGKTKEALKAFQQSLGLNPDGALTAETALELKKYL